MPLVQRFTELMQRRVVARVSLCLIWLGLLIVSLANLFASDRTTRVVAALEVFGLLLMGLGAVLVWREATHRRH